MDKVLKSIKSLIEKQKDDSGWVNLAPLGKAMVDSGISYRGLGYSKLKDVFEDYDNYFEIRCDDECEPPIMYVRLKTNRKVVSRNESSFNDGDLLHWADMGDFQDALKKLKDIALAEEWGYRTSRESNLYPILSSYIRHTFGRLTCTGKIKYADKEYAAFNTGLVDNGYESIYALFAKCDHKDKKQYWKFLAFCVAGQNKYGKLLVEKFSQLPIRATYIDDPSVLLFDDSKGISCDWEHIILENISRLPVKFLEPYLPENFCLNDKLFKDSDYDGERYCKQVTDIIRNDKKVFRSIKNAFEKSLDVSIKKVTWNYRVAVPTYYPKTKNVSLLFPLSLCDEDYVDLALVVERSNSTKNYIGHTILPLNWAYNNARLISRLDSDWLVASLIEEENV